MVDPDSGDITDTLWKNKVFEHWKTFMSSLPNLIVHSTSCKDYYLWQDIDNYDEVNEIYAEKMSAPYPARSAIEVADFPIDIKVEIELSRTHFDNLICESLSIWELLHCP